MGGGRRDAEGCGKNDYIYCTIYLLYNIFTVQQIYSTTYLLNIGGKTLSLGRCRRDAEGCDIQQHKKIQRLLFTLQHIPKNDQT